MLMPPLKRYAVVEKNNGELVFIDYDHPLYNLRYGILTRCYNPKAKDYKYYQAKGIHVCDEWKNDAASFYKWCLDNGWQKGLSIDRINTNKNYEPDNCRFISRSENTRRMHKEQKTIGENAAHVKLKEDQVREIRKLIEIGVPCTKIAKKFNVSSSTIKAIKSGQNWSHLI